MSNRVGSPNGPTRKAKRKLSPLRIVDKAQVSNAIQPFCEKPIRRAQPPSIHMPNPEVPTHSEVWAEEELRPLRQSLKTSMKGKKVIARHKAPQVNTMCTASIS